MASRTFASMATTIAPSVPGCPQPVIEKYVREAAIRVCERTLAWRYEQPTFTLTAGQYAYEYNKPADTDITAVFGAHVNNSRLEHLTLEQALCRYPEWADIYSGMSLDLLWDETASGSFGAFAFSEEVFAGGGEFTLPEAALTGASTPRVIVEVTPDKYIVLPLPDDAVTYTMRMVYALKPSRSATGMDERAFYDLEDAILHNTLQHLLVLPNYPWSDRQLATYHAKQALREMMMRKAQANLGNVRGVLVAQIPRFV